MTLGLVEKTRKERKRLLVSAGDKSQRGRERERWIENGERERGREARLVPDI